MTAHGLKGNFFTIMTTILNFPLSFHFSMETRRCLIVAKRIKCFIDSVQSDKAELWWLPTDVGSNGKLKKSLPADRWEHHFECCLADKIRNSQIGRFLPGHSCHHCIHECCQAGGRCCADVPRVSLQLFYC